MYTFRQVKDALSRAFCERGTRRVLLTVAVAFAGFVVGAMFPSDRVLVGAGLATLLVVVLQVCYGVTERGDRSPFEAATPEREVADQE
ncbi:hypothetical protein ACWEF6_12615 [Amycolatopsis sp. NPDC004772]